MTTPELPARPTSETDAVRVNFARLSSRWADPQAVDLELCAQSKDALRAVQPDDLPAIEPLVSRMLAALGGLDGGRVDVRDATRRALFALLDTVRRRFFLQAMRPSEVDPWTALTVSVVLGADYTVGDLLRSREETDPRVVAFRVLGAEACEVTVADVGRRTRALARGVLSLLRGAPDGTVAILSENRLEAALCDLACLSNGIVDFPLPANAVADQIVYMLRHSGARVLLVSDQEQLAKVLPSLGSLPDLRDVVVFDRRAAAQHGLLSLEQMIDQGSEAFAESERAARAARVRSGDLATALYTSGTTGRPKAIAFNHLNIVSKRFCRAFALPRVGEGDVFLAYLPLYHTFGRWLELTGSLFWGATYVFARSTSRASLIEDFRNVRPTIFISVPKKWIELHETARREASADEPQAEAEALSALCGGRLRHGLSAAGYLDPEIFHAFHAAGVELCSGYGMTEATGGITMTPPGAYVEGSIGRPLPGIEARRADDGELLIRGPYVSAGYYRPEPEDVGASADGWFATGDLVTVDARGHHAIAGRKKEIYKNRMGQTIAPQRVENLFRDFEAVGQAFLVGDHREYNTLLVWPNREGNPALVDMTPEQLHDLIASLVASANRFLAPFERVVTFAILPRALDEAHGELTAKQSFKREVVEKNWAALIDTLYGEKHVTLTIEGVTVRVPKWVLREMSVLQHEVTLVGSVLSAGGRPLPIGVPAEAPDTVRVGDIAYVVEGGTLDLGALLARPSQWLGNEPVRAFLGGEAFLSLVSQRRRGGAELRIDPRVWQAPDPARVPALVQRVEAADVTFLSLHASGELLRGSRAEARRAIQHLSRALGGGGDYAALGQALLRRAADAPDEEVRRLALGALLPSEAPERTVGTLRAFVDRLGRGSLRDEDFAALGESLQGPQIDALFAFLNERAVAAGGPPTERALVGCVTRILASCAIAHPRHYAAVRVPLARLAFHPDDELAAHAREELDRVRHGFGSWIGPNLRRAHDPETGAAYGWKDVAVFDESVGDRAREVLLRAMAETTMVRASIFLFGKGTLLSLADIPPGGVRVATLGGGTRKSVYRLTVETRSRDVHEVCVNVSESVRPMDLHDEMDWLLAVGASPPIVEAFGGYYPELGVFTEEYMAGLNVAAQAERLSRMNEGRRLRTLWPFLAQTAFELHVRFWDRTGRRVALAAPGPEAFVIPAHDYQGGARLVSIGHRSACDGIDALVDRFRASFVAPLARRYPDLAGLVSDDHLLAAAVEALGEAAARSLFAASASGPRAEPIAAALGRLKAEGHTPLRVANAVRRYGRWISVNPAATVEARGLMLGELWSTYRLAEVEATAPDTRVRFFRQTVFVDARPELLVELDRLMARARSAPFTSLDVLGEHLAAHRVAIEPTPEEDYFLARMTYRHLEPSDEASLIAIPRGDKKLATIVMALRDLQGDPYFVRPPASPREVARLLQLLHESNLTVTIQADSEALLALDAREKVIGGLFWHFRTPVSAHMDKIVVARSHRGKGVGAGLLHELLRRLRGRGALRVGTGYYQAEYFKQYGFRTDPTSGGVVVNLEAIPGGSIPPVAGGAP